MSAPVFDAASHFDYGTIASFNHTCAAGATDLYVGVRDDGGANSGVTYNGVAMTLLDSAAAGGGTGYLWHLANPPSGTHAIVVQGTVTGGVAAASYTGGGSIDNHGSTTTASGTSISKSLTTTADNCWGVALCMDRTGTAPTGVTHFTARSTPGAGASMVLGDSNAAFTPPGSFTMALSDSGSSAAVLLMATFSAPSLASGRMFEMF